MSKPLSESGIEDVKGVADLLRKLGVEPVHIFHSGILRAQQTAEYIAEILNRTDCLDVHEALDPTRDVHLIAQLFKQSQEDVFVVSHMPFVGKLVSLLVTGEESKDILCFQTGMVVCLEYLGHSEWTIQWIIHPDLVR